MLDVVQSTTLRLNKIMWSPKGKRVLVQLLVLWEENCVRTVEMKETKWQ